MNVVIAGGGPSGTSAAIAMRRLGFTVDLFERREQWKGRVCGSFLSPEATRHLEWLGLSPEKSSGCYLPTTRLSFPNGQFLDIRTEDSFGETWAVPREKLEEMLLSKSQSEGAVVHLGSRVLSHRLDKNKVIVDVSNGTTNRQIEADLFIIASGRYGLEKIKPSTGWFGFNGLFAGVKQKPSEQSLHFFPGGYIGAVTYESGLTNVCGLLQKTSNWDWATTYENIKSIHPPFAELMRDSSRQSPWMGVGPLPFRIFDENHQSNVGLDRILWVGDARRTGDPFMGEGIGRALAAGPMLFQAFAHSWQEGASEYNRIWRKTYRARFWAGSVLRTMMGHQRTFSFFQRLARSKNRVRFLTPILHAGF